MGPGVSESLLFFEIFLIIFFPIFIWGIKSIMRERHSLKMIELEKEMEREVISYKSRKLRLIEMNKEIERELLEQNHLKEANQLLKNDF